jgi:hypothetical protein
MRRSRHDQFREFVRERTSELFPVAYALAGRQDAAEKLLQSALERTWLRWRRLDDPYEFTVRAMRRAALPWWRRWRPGAAAPVPPAATGGRAVDLADLALAGALRHRLARVGSMVAAAAVIVAGVAVAPGLLDREQTPEVHLTGRSVVASYHAGGLHVLNPDTGEYELRLREQGLVSPDLRRVARLSAGAVVIESTVSDEQVHTAPLPLDYPSAVAWSPDSTRLVVTARCWCDGFSPLHHDLEEWLDTLGAGYRTVVVVDATTGDHETVTLDFPDGQGGWDDPVVGAFWVDANHLAVPTVDSARMVEQLFRQGGQPVYRWFLTAVTVFDLTGTLVAELPLPTDDLDASDDPHAGMMWRPTGMVRDGRFLLSRMPTPETLELAAVDLAAGTGPTDVVAVEAPPPDPVVNQEFLPIHSFFARPYAWLPDGRVLVESYDTAAYTRSAFVTGHGTSTLIVDLNNGHAQTVEVLSHALAGELADRIPHGAEMLLFADAAGLSPHAAHLAF